MNLKELELKLNDYKIISFDFFDTLFLRKVEDPESVFDLVGMKFGIDNFKVLRKEAQKLAFAEMITNDKKEITLDNIYDNFKSLNSTKINEIKSYEFKAELDVIYPNPEIIFLFETALKLNKIVVITSDMYLPVTYFELCLEKYNLPKTPLFISSDRNSTKRDNGEIFEKLINEFTVAPEDILHIGDNYLADVEKAEEKGLNAYYYEFSEMGMSKNISISDSVVSGLTDYRIHNFPVDSGENFAYSHGGPTVTGFNQWLLKASSKDNIDVLLYLARDGYMIKKCTDMASTKNNITLPSLYFKGSRTSFILSSITSCNFNEYIPYFVSGAYELSAHELFERIGVVPPSQKVLDSLGFYEDIALKNINYDSIYNLLSSMKKDILKVCRENRRGLHLLLSELNLPENANIGIVDVGWKGSTQEAFEAAIAPYFKFNIYGYYFCLTERHGDNKRSMISDMNFSDEKIDAIYKNRIVFELLFSAPHETIIGHIPCEGGVSFIEDDRQSTARTFFTPFERGMVAFFDEYEKLVKCLDFTPEVAALITPFVEFAISGEWKKNQYISHIQNFDAWSATKNMTFTPSQYI
ncbi:MULTISPECIES: hypothetical protein [Rahnella]|uniref:HAD family hydrolase n=1 Tax=Rahnella laticis TaxID=2787622 RepID=A0ABS0E5A7_9GAMM|nr:MULTISPECIES: hypothetical protein [Rahnella]MBF7980259.1 hypothetical protein [Rahnella laticis]MBF8000482.1 hypothetical protein [Rahnella sp. LAC-M12]